MKVTNVEIYCDRCKKSMCHPYRIISTSDHHSYELCEKCSYSFYEWINDHNKSLNKIPMEYVGSSSHDCESHYKCPICHRDYGSWKLFSIHDDTITCKCGQVLIIPR